MENQPLPPNLKIWQIALGFASTSVICALIRAGVIEQLRETAKTLQQLSEECEVDSNVLFRILRFAAAIDLISLSDNKYSLTETGKFLLKDVPGSLYGGIMLIGAEPWQKSWNNLFYSLKSGEAAFNQAMGSPFFEYLNAHPEHGEPFHNWMTSISIMASKIIPEAYDFSAYKTVCDVGGGQGILLKGILAANPGLKGILYDQEAVVKDHILAEMADRIEIKSGSFFDAVPSADILIMKNILHDWSNDKSLKILEACKKAMSGSAKLLIIEMVVGGNLGLIGLFYDLHMQVLLAGKERTEDEFRELLKKAGLKLIRVIKTKSPLSIIEASL